MQFPGDWSEKLALETIIARNAESEIERERIWQALATERIVASRLVRARRNRERWLVLERSEGAG